MLKAAGRPPQGLVRQLSGNLKDKTVGVIGMGHVGKLIFTPVLEQYHAKTHLFPTSHFNSKVAFDC